MNNKIVVFTAIAIAFLAGSFVNKVSNYESHLESINNLTNSIINVDNTVIKTEDIMKETDLKLGAFSVSLSVKDLKVSKAFYEKLGFKSNGGSLDMNYLIMKNENAIIGLFQGMFDDNILTFNPGWDESANNIEEFDDVRVIQKKLKDQDLTLMTEAPDSTQGPASFMLTDPDGNIILVDQHH